MRANAGTMHSEVGELLMTCPLAEAGLADRVMCRASGGDTTSLFTDGSCARRIRPELEPAKKRDSRSDLVFFHMTMCASAKARTPCRVLA